MEDALIMLRINGFLTIFLYTHNRMYGAPVDARNREPIMKFWPCVIVFAVAISQCSSKYSSSESENATKSPRQEENFAVIPGQTSDDEMTHDERTKLDADERPISNNASKKQQNKSQENPQKGGLADIKKDLGELKTQVDKLVEQKNSLKASGDRQNKLAKQQKIRDKNFETIVEAKDKLAEILDKNREVMITPTVDDVTQSFKLLLESMRNYVGHNNQMREVPRLVDEIMDTRAKLLVQERTLCLLLRICSLIVEQNGLVDSVMDMDHIAIINQAQIGQMLSRLWHILLKFATNEEINLINDIESGVMRQNFDGKPNVPSYFLFNLLNTILQLINKKIDSAEELSKTLSRGMTSLAENLVRQEEDLAANEKSDKTPPILTPYITARRQLVQYLQTYLSGLKKGCSDKTGDLVKCGKEIAKVTSNLTTSKKHSEVFESAAPQVP
ncbi:MAG: hypothetical protein LBF56_00590 [Holosporales bacterium]|jgi:hypothetical protein|nr:hypothetical protein [Holosporales bacterium]